VISKLAPACPFCGAPTHDHPPNASDKSRLAALLLCFCLGVFGVHRFYVGKIGTGLLQLVTIGGLGIWSLVDFILIAVGAFTDKQGKKVDTNGFAEFTSNTRKAPKRGAAAEAEEDSKPIHQQILDDLAKAPKDRPNEEEINRKLTDYISKHATPQDHLLLFRYVDFNVEPGKIYRYRVRLEVENPFHNRHAEEVADPSIIEKKFWDTEVSEPTKPIYVPEPAHFYVMHVVGDAGRSSLPWAKVDLYQWFASTGTIVNKEVIAQIGQLLGGLHQAKVLNPTDNTDDTEKVPFVTNDALVDVAAGFSLDPGLHKDLISEIASAETKDKTEPKEHKASDKDKRNVGSMVPDVLVFVDGNGALRVIDGLDQNRFILWLKWHIFLHLGHDLPGGLYSVRDEKGADHDQQQDEWK